MRQARRKAADIYKIRVTEGGDPAREAKRETNTRLKRGKNVEWLINEFIKRHAEPNCVESTTRAYKNFFDNWVIPAIGNRPIGSIKKGDLIEMFNAIADGNEKIWPGKEGNHKNRRTRSHLLRHLMFNWAASEDLIEHSPSLSESNNVQERKSRASASCPTMRYGQFGVQPGNSAFMANSFGSSF